MGDNVMYRIDPYKLLQRAFGDPIDWYDLNDENHELAMRVGTELYVLETPKAAAILDVYISHKEMIIDIAAQMGGASTLQMEEAVQKKIYEALQYEYAMDPNVAAYGKWHTATSYRIYLLNGEFDVK